MRDEKIASESRKRAEIEETKRNNQSISTVVASQDILLQNYWYNSIEERRREYEAKKGEIRYYCDPVLDEEWKKREEEEERKLKEDEEIYKTSEVFTIDDYRKLHKDEKRKRREEDDLRRAQAIKIASDDKLRENKDKMAEELIM